MFHYVERCQRLTLLRIINENKSLRCRLQHFDVSLKQQLEEYLQNDLKSQTGMAQETARFEVLMEQVSSTCQAKGLRDASQHTIFAALVGRNDRAACFA
jgi:hypothetical protein